MSLTSGEACNCGKCGGMLKPDPGSTYSREELNMFADTGPFQRIANDIVKVIRLREKLADALKELHPLHSDPVTHLGTVAPRCKYCELIREAEKPV